MASRRCTHSASRRRRNTASPSASGSAWDPSPRCGRLPAARFLRGATALHGSGAATAAAMPLTSPARARAAAMPRRHRLASHRTSSPSPHRREVGPCVTAGRLGAGIGCCPAGQTELGLPAGGAGVRPGRSGCSDSASDHRGTSLRPRAHRDRPSAIPSWCQGLFRSLPIRGSLTSSRFL